MGRGAHRIHGEREGRGVVVLPRVIGRLAGLGLGVDDRQSPRPLRGRGGVRTLRVQGGGAGTRIARAATTASGTGRRYGRVEMNESDESTRMASRFALGIARPGRGQGGLSGGQVLGVREPWGRYSTRIPDPFSRRRGEEPLEWAASPPRLPDHAGVSFSSPSGTAARSLWPGERDALPVAPWLGRTRPHSLFN